MARLSIFRRRAGREQATAKPGEPLPEGAAVAGSLTIGAFLIRLISPAPIPEDAPKTLTAAAIRETRRARVRQEKRDRRKKAKREQPKKVEAIIATDAEQARIRAQVDAEERERAEREEARKTARAELKRREQERRRERLLLALERARRMGCGVNGITLEPEPGTEPGQCYYPAQTAVEVRRPYIL